MLWDNLTSNEFPEAVKQAKGVCALPVGCVEKHGAHLPLGTDVIHSGGIAALAAEKEPVVVFPTMYFGEKTGAGEFPGTLIFSEETRWAIFKESCREIYRNGFRKIIICNGHGGNTAMLNFFSRAMMQVMPELMTFICKTGSTDLSALIEGKYSYLTKDDINGLKVYVNSNPTAGHGCLAETGSIYALRPDLVDLNKVAAESGESIHRFDAFEKKGITTHFAWMGNYPNSYSASTDPYIMNERIAKAILEDCVNYLADVFKFLKEEIISDTYHKEWLPKQGF